MGELFRTVSGGLTRFVLAWVLPSAIVIGAIGLFLVDGLADLPIIGDFVDAVRPPPEASAVSAWLFLGLVYAFLVLVTSVILAYGSLPLYRLLEGYTIPAPLRRWLLERQLREWVRLRRSWNRYLKNQRLAEPRDLELLQLYPEGKSAVRPTRLGNAFARLETFGITRYGLDSQTMWYELLAVSSDAARRNVEESRASVDFFVSSIGNLGLLCGVAILACVSEVDRPKAVALAVAAAGLLPLAYSGAIQNMKEWANSVKALVTLGRMPLSRRIGIVPEDATLKSERDMWLFHLYAIEYAHEVTEPQYDQRRVWDPDAGQA